MDKDRVAREIRRDVGAVVLHGHLGWLLVVQDAMGSCVMYTPSSGPFAMRSCLRCGVAGAVDPDGLTGCAAIADAAKVVRTTTQVAAIAAAGRRILMFFIWRLHPGQLVVLT